ncbi:GNAT family N-acetyltransferase [Aurantibacter sp.]|uniref:GNAT family N-acetyltransferase n=1 Tax=Aurantibacter sp. TaxID=2807103 RepID=UPI0032636AAF
MIVIVKANFEHVNDIVIIGKQTFIESHGNSASDEDVNKFNLKTYTKEAIKVDLENEKVQYHLIYFNNKVAGFSKIELDVSNENINQLKITKLDKIYLLEEFYGHKLGPKLFDHIVTKSKRNDQKGMWLAVWIENQRAIKFYSKMGFIIVGAYDFKLSETHSNPNHIMYLEY